MSDSTKCDHCGRPHLALFSAAHAARYRFLVFDLESDPEEEFPQKVCGMDAEAAAERWADEMDAHNDYHALDGGSYELVVVAPDGTRTRWNVTGEAEPVYYATPVEDEEVSP